ncbi:hypothetical protein HPY42_02715 [Coprothermobacteraceae bacterium]|nr:hypothetical protein [Coprothermobacteraceae bacterium]
MYKVLAAVVALLVLLIVWWGYNEFRTAVSLPTGKPQFSAQGVSVSVPYLSGNSIGYEEQTLYAANPDVLMKYLALQEVKTGSPIFACLAKGFDGTRLYLDPNCYVDASNKELFARIVQAVKALVGENTLTLGDKPLVEDPVSRIIGLGSYYFLPGEQGVSLVLSERASLNEFFDSLQVKPSTQVQDMTAHVDVDLPNVDENVAYAMALNVEHFMKVDGAVISVNGVKFYEHKRPYGLKLAKTAGGFVVTGEAKDLTDIQGFLNVARLNESGGFVDVVLNSDTSNTDYELALMVLNTLRGKSVRVLAGPYSMLGSFPASF